ncbi:MAG TPA: RcnB family protein [Allosphingosinicella sp.]|jgi:Ni/Co efflux regulator RcnB
MRKLWLFGCAATAALAFPAQAQTVPDSDFAMPKASLAIPAAAAMAMHPGPNVEVRHVRPPVRDMQRGHDMQRGEIRHVETRRHPGAPRRWSRIDRGGFVPGMWAGPQFVVRDWRMHGFSQPFSGGRWIRYYDDALLVDRYGRVHDGRYGYDWRRDRDRWSQRDGVPVYVGDGDFEPGEWDYEWAERWDRDEGDYAYGRGGPPIGGCHNPCTHTYPGPGPAYGHGYGYGAGYGYGYGPMVVTETITTTAPVVETVTYYEYETEEVTTQRRAYRKPVRRAPVRRAPPPPRPGERG